MTTLENDPTGAGWIISPEFHDNDHCPACGYDLGTHHPTCTTAYPNRQHPAADHATETERAIANLFSYARDAMRQGLKAAPSADYAQWFALEDKLTMSLETLCHETGSSISLVYDVARDIA